MTDKQLQEAAYYNWLNKGCPENADLDCWLEAEKSNQVNSKTAAEKTVAKPAAKKPGCKTKKSAKK